MIRVLIEKHHGFITLTVRNPSNPVVSRIRHRLGGKVLFTTLKMSGIPSKWKHSWAQLKDLKIELWNVQEISPFWERQNH